MAQVMAHMAHGMTARTQRLRAELAAQLVETGHAEDVWLALPGVVQTVARIGFEPRDLLAAVTIGALRVRWFGPRPIPRDPNPEMCGINAAELLGWLLEQDTPVGPLH